MRKRGRSHEHSEQMVRSHNRSGAQQDDPEGSGAEDRDDLSDQKEERWED